MIVRIWRTHVGQARAGDYRGFAHSRSLPMFRMQPGFAGALFAARQAERQAERAVITLWRDLASAPAPGQSRAYQATVAEIEATGFLRRQSTTEIFELEEVFLEKAALGAEQA
jgi:hypothetical protein